MSTEETQTAPIDSPTVIVTPAPEPKSFSRTTARIITDQLQKIRHAGSMKTSGPDNPRYITLNRNEIFTALVELYTLHFEAKWDIIKRLVRAFQTPNNVSSTTYLARVYISHWFLDVYVSNREACSKLPLARNSDHFRQEIGTQSSMYDNYLTLLLNSLKPTRLHGKARSSLLIPLITDRPTWTNNTTLDYFNIRHFTTNTQLFSALIHLMKDPAYGWLLNTYSNDVLGRPFWLLDWHKSKAYAWFPEDENYNRDDLVLAFILGVSCTPHLAPRDDDIPQQYPDNLLPTIDAGYTHNRRIPTQFHGNYSRRVIEHPTHESKWEEDIPQAEVEDARKKAIAECTRSAEAIYNQLLSELKARRAQAGLGGTEGQQPEQEELDAIKKIAETSISMPKVPTTREVVYHAAMFKIGDYKYYHKVVRKIEINTRAAAHKIMIYKD